MIKITSAVIFFCILLFPAFAFSYCSEPSAPLGGVPSKPFCGSLGDLSDCDQWDIDRYKREIEEYIDEMREYAEDAIEYAQCEQEEATQEWNRFIRGN